MRYANALPVLNPGRCQILEAGMQDRSFNYARKVTLAFHRPI
jgi:hypothetical protein